MDEPTATGAQPCASARRDRRETVLLVLAIVLVSLNLRSMLTVIGPLIRDVKAGDGLSSTGAGLLAAAPLLAFGLISPLGPELAARFGIERTLVASMVVLSASLALRPLPGVVLLFAGTVAAGAAIAVANVLLPALVKRRFGDQATFVTGIYSVALGLGAALAAGLAVPSEGWLGDSWRAALAVWSVPALLSALIWLPLLRDVPDRGASAAHVRVNLWRDRLAWTVTSYMALLAVQFYSMVAWLPEIYRHEGMSKGSAGALLSLSLIVGIPCGFIVGALAGRMRDQRPIVAAAGLLTLGGWIGVLVAPNAAPSLWAILLGLGFGTGFTLVLSLFVLRADDAPHAVALSGMAQSVGYTLAAIGPIAVGALHDVTGGWTVPLAALVGVAAADLAIGFGAGRDRYVRGRLVGEAEPASRAPDAEPAAAGVGAPR
jgi:CP family cyanate transporter-like MFS transporter